jgi:VWFA-related protein
VPLTLRTLTTRVGLRLTLVAGTTVCLTAQQPQPTFRTEANFVRVDVFATQGGVPIGDLSAGDFELLEDGVAQKIETFEHVVVRPAGAQETRAEPDSQRQGNQMAEDPRARVFVIFLDTYHVSVQGSHNISGPLIRLLDRVIGQEDLVGVMTPEMSAANLTLGRKTQVLESALTDNWVWGRRFQITGKDPKEEQYEDCYTGWADGEEVIREMVSRRRERLTLDAVQDLVRHLRGVREERKAIITVSEGWLQYKENSALARPLKPSEDPRAKEVIPGTPEIYVGPGGRPTTGADPTGASGGTLYECDADRQRLAFTDNERYFREILDEANRANASFYPVDPRGLPVFDTPIGPDPPLPVNVDRVSLKNRQESLRTMAVATDGIAVMNSNDIDAGLKRMSADLTSYYLLGYYSSNTKLDGRFRAIKVRVKRPGVDVRARRGYRAATAEEVTAARLAAAPPGGPGSDGESQLGTQAGAQLSLAVSTALGRLSVSRSNRPFQLHAVVVRARDGLKAWIEGELDSTTSRMAKWAKGADASVTASDGKGRGSASETGIDPPGRSFVVQVPVAGGGNESVSFQARLRPRGESALPLQASVSARRPEEGRAFLAVEPLVFTLRGQRTIPIAGFRVYRTERIRLELPLASDAKPGDARLLDRTGKPLSVPVVVSERDDAAEGLRWLVADVNPAPLGPGDYVVELSATLGSKSDVVVTAVRILS